MRFVTLAVLPVLAATLAAAPASGSRYVRYGVQDDAWLASGPGTLEHRLDLLERAGVSVVRFTLRWDQIAAARPADGRDPDDPAYRWEPVAGVLEGLHARGIDAVVGWVRRWLIWNEPNRTRWLRPTTPQAYTQLLNAAYVALHRANPRAVVAGGVTAPRGGQNGVSPVDWIRGLRRYRAKLDAYAHNPYPSGPSETPWRGGCSWRGCETITMATLERLLGEVERAFGRRARIWLTEYGYQTNPPDRLWGVSPARQARLVGSAARRAHAARRVDLLIHFMVRDDTYAPGWQSGLFTTRGSAKPAFRAFMLPLAQESRRGLRTVVWGQVRPRTGRQPYRLQQYRDGRWRTVGGTYRTSSRGFLRRVVRAAPGSRLRLWSPRDATASPILVVR
jgi:hypothetical protein